jgi:hypothetical protein
MRAWRRPTLPHLEVQYHWRRGFSRPSSGWDRVFGPSLWPPGRQRFCHVTKKCLLRPAPLSRGQALGSCRYARRCPALLEEAPGFKRQSSD